MTMSRGTVNTRLKVLYLNARSIQNKVNEIVAQIKVGSFLEQFMVGPTGKQTVLDLVMCSEADLIRELNGKELLEGSDHNMIEFTLQFKRKKVELDVMVLQLNKGNYRSMREELTRIDWERSLAGKTVEQQWQEFLG
eukprot:g27836.t1